MAKQKPSDKRTDAAVLGFLILFTFMTSIIFSTGLFISNILFFGLPIFYLLVRSRKGILRNFIFSIIICLTTGMLVDYVGFISKS